MNEQNTYSEITPEILNLAKRCASIDRIDEELYRKYEVKRGLRDISGKGVLAGLTDISEIISYTIEDNDMIPCEGRLFYRGYNIQDLVGGLIRDKRFGYEEIAYLLLSGSLPDEKELADFSRLIGEYRTLPTSFVRDIILKAPSQDMMNTLARSVLTLYSYDDRAGRYLPSQRAAPVHSADRPVSRFLRVYGYQAYSHYHDGQQPVSSIAPVPGPFHGGEYPAHSPARQQIYGAGSPRCWILR